MLNLNDLAKQSLLIAERRGLSTDVLSTLKHCGGEVVEATEAFTRFNMLGEHKDYHDFSSELADIIICVLSASAKEDVDIEDALNRAMTKNARRAYGTKD